MAITDSFKKGESLFSTTLVSGIGTGTGETITLDSVSGLPTDTELTLTIDRVDADGESTPSATERITGTISGSTLTSYTRGTDGTTEQSHSAEAVVEYIFNSQDWNDLIDGILVGHSQTGHHTITIADEDNTTGITVTQNDVTNNPNGITINNTGTGDALYINSDDGMSINIDTEEANDGTIIQITPAGTSPSAFLINRNDDVTGNIVLRLGGNYLWFDATGDLRAHTANPDSDTAGVVIGSQS